MSRSIALYRICTGGLQLALSAGPGLWIMACNHSLGLGVVFESRSGLRKYLDRDQARDHQKHRNRSLFIIT